jgi:hypothetical protein
MEFGAGDGEITLAVGLFKRALNVLEEAEEAAVAAEECDGGTTQYPLENGGIKGGRLGDARGHNDDNDDLFTGSEDEVGRCMLTQG